MKTLLLTASLAVTAAVAAELKDPDEVSKEWNRTFAERLPSLVSPTLSGLIASLAPTEPGMPATFRPENQPKAKARRPERSPGPLYDWPSHPSVRRQPPEIPDQAIPWLYRDQQYWLVPLGGAPD